MAHRFEHCLKHGLLELSDGHVMCFGSAVPPVAKDKAVIVSPSRPETDALKSMGWTCTTYPDGTAAMALITLPREKARAKSWIAQASQAVGAGVIIVDGAKTDGVDTLLGAVKARTQSILGHVPKAHGRCFWFCGGKFDDWLPKMRNIGGFSTYPGVFSADGPDSGSRALLAHLPDLSGRVADLGAGWGFLSRHILEHESVSELHLVEADNDALACAQHNVCDARARFHWADATTWAPQTKMHTVIMNPPFHEGRKGKPELGQAFIQTAARILMPRGKLYMVANRHLPYEATLQTTFSKITSINTSGGFKILVADTPRLRR